MNILGISRSSDAPAMRTIPICGEAVFGLLTSVENYFPAVCHPGYGRD